MIKDKLVDKIKKIQEDKDLGISVRRICNKNVNIFILYIAQITNRESISTNVIKPILQYDKENITIDTIANSIVYLDNISICNDENKIIDYILKGNSIIVIPEDEKYIVANTFKVQKRSVQTPYIQESLKGPMDAFGENFETNLSLIRYRIKDEFLKIDNCTIGKRTKTSVAMIYISDIANPQYINNVKNKLNNINIDGIIDSGYIAKFLREKTFNLFPEVGTVERSDTACAEILNGKICIVVEGSNLVLILPKTFIEFLDANEDHYKNTYLAIFIKFLRMLSFIITLTLSSVYIAVVSFSPDILPPHYVLVLATSRMTVPVNSLMEIIAMETIAELLKEASIRLPKQIGPAIGIVGTIVIGQAAVTAGLVSPITVIIISLTTMTSFIFPDHTIASPMRILKFFMIIITGIFGMFGFTMGITFIVINLVAQTSFGVPYTAPIAPFNGKDIKNYIFSDITLDKNRPEFLRPKDKKRQ